MTLAATTRKPVLDFVAYLYDRFTQADQIPPLTDLIAARAPQPAGALVALTSPTPPCRIEMIPSLLSSEIL